MKALRKLSINNKTFYLLRWDENHSYKKTPYFLRDDKWLFVSSLWESKSDPDLLLFDVRRTLYGSLRLSTGAVELFGKQTYWRLSKPREKRKSEKSTSPSNSVDFVPDSDTTNENGIS